MPYDRVDQLPDNVKSSLSAKEQRKWLHVFNSVYKETGSEERARNAAWSVVKKGQGE